MTRVSRVIQSRMGLHDVTVRDLRNQGREVIDRVVAGETLTVTRDGRPVASLSPIERVPLAVEEVRRRWRGLPSVEPERLRRDLDDVLDPAL